MIRLTLLIIIYLAFISLGLPDSLLGVAWPSMQAEWAMPIDAAGLIAMLVTGSTILSSFLSSYVIDKFGTGKITFISCVITGVSLLGISYSPSYLWLLVLAIPLGLGAGSVDTALNNYVALHFKAHHMNWLHSFWGVGATIGPFIMSKTILKTSSWRLGYQNIAGFQITLAVVLFFCLPLWTMHNSKAKENITIDVSENSLIKKQIKPFKVKGVKYALATFFFYCATELSIGLWGSSYLIQVKDFSIEKAALFVALYYGGITIGRFVSGFISFKLSNAQLIRWGILIAFASVIMLLLPVPNFILISSLVGIGFGLSPIFPSMLHSTPVHFGEIQSQSIIGYQMAFGYIGSSFVPPLFGVLAKNTNISIFPYYLVICIIIILLCTEKLSSLSTKSKEGFNECC